MREIPQEGFLSPLVWNVAFDDLPDRFKSGPAHIKGFANDAAIVLQGPNIHTLIEQGQEAISRALEFGSENDLKFWVDKTEVIVFTCNRLRVSDLLYFCMENRDLAYSDTVKYCGIMLDSKLPFGPHIRHKAIKAVRLLYHFKASVGQMWSPNQFLMCSHGNCLTEGHIWSYSLGK